MSLDNLLDTVLTMLDSELVLCDVGASGAVPEIWRRIAKRAVYIGFDPDLREMGHLTSSPFKSQLIVNKAVTDSDVNKFVKFYLARSPFCSSTLQPNVALLAKYTYADLFDIVGEESAPATTLRAVLAHAALSAIDWLKLDTQGTDLRILNSLDPGTFAELLAVDIEPGLQQNYVDEDTFADVHESLTHRGFWLSNLDVHGAVRMQPSTVTRLHGLRPELSETHIKAQVRPSPMWVEARYLRTIESVASAANARRNLVILWVFSLLDSQPGFAMDIAVEYERRYGRDNLLPLLQSAPFDKAGMPARVKALIPRRIKQWIKRQNS